MDTCFDCVVKRVAGAYVYQLSEHAVMRRLPLSGTATCALRLADDCWVWLTRCEIALAVNDGLQYSVSCTYSLRRVTRESVSAFQY
jgi:hypothetical protein